LVFSAGPTFTGTVNAAALTLSGALTANGNVVLGNIGGGDTIAINGIITTNLIFEGSTANDFETTLVPGNPGSDISINMPDWAGTMVVGSGTGTSGHLLVSTGNSTAPAWTDPATLVVGGVKVNFQNSISSAIRYPIPFLGSNRQTNATDPDTFSTYGEGTYENSYLYANYGNQGSGGLNNGTYENYTSGLFYEVNDSSGSGKGTLFCDYIGATLDCGTY